MSGMPGTNVIQITNLSAAVSSDQMRTLFGFLGDIDELRLYPPEWVITTPNTHHAYVLTQNTHPPERVTTYHTLIMHFGYTHIANRHFIMMTTHHQHHIVTNITSFGTRHLHTFKHTCLTKNVTVNAIKQPMTHGHTHPNNDDNKPSSSSSHAYNIHNHQIGTHEIHLNVIIKHHKTANEWTFFSVSVLYLQSFHAVCII